MRGPSRLAGALTLAVGLVACEQGPSSDPTAQACEAYTQAFANDDAEAMDTALNRMAQLANNVDQADDSGAPVLAPEIFVVLLTNGPQPWESIQYEFMNEECTKYLEEA